MPGYQVIFVNVILAYHFAIPGYKFFFINGIPVYQPIFQSYTGKNEITQKNLHKCPYWQISSNQNFLQQTFNAVLLIFVFYWFAVNREKTLINFFLLVSDHNRYFFEKLKKKKNTPPPPWRGSREGSLKKNEVIIFFKVALCLISPKLVLLN